MTRDHQVTTGVILKEAHTLSDQTFSITAWEVLA